MDLPSMVQRSGDTLIVRSVVSGNQLYMDQTNKQAINTNNNNNNNGNNNSPIAQQHQNNSVLEQQLERYRAAAVAAQQQRLLQQNSHITQTQQQQNNQTEGSTNVPITMLETKEDGLPQCKIKRNYSCSYCTYFTQNPRSHLTHLRDVHGEKIVINKCELCLYASRHFQKLVRHMKMVHGCTDGLPSAHGQPRGKRGMSREARKRKLEQSVGLNVRGVNEMPSIEQVKRELQLQEQKLHTLAKQQEEQKQQQQQLANSAAEALFVAAYERQLKAQHERDLEALQAAAARAASYETDVAQQQRQSSTSPNFQIPPAHQQRASSATPSRQLELSPSPTGSISPATTITTYASPNAGHGDIEQPQNRLIKCSVCDFTTLYREQLIDHEVEEHYKTKFFRCEKCSYVTHIKARFSKHVKYHSMPMIKCVACDFRTPYKWNLDRHMKNHGGAGPFKCAACDFTADIKQSLTVHEMNHHVPPVGHAAGMSLARRRNKVGGTDLSDDFLSDSADMMEDNFNNNNLDDYDDALVIAEDKIDKYTDEEPTDLSQKGGSSDTSSVHNQAITPRVKHPVPNLIPISKPNNSVLNLSKNITGSRSSLTDIASMFFSDKQLSEMLQPFDKADAAQLSPTTTIASTSSQNSRSLLRRPASAVAGSFFDKLKSSAFSGAGPNGNLVCPCGHIAKCLSESIIHRKSCNLAAMTVDDDLDEEPDDTDGGRLEIDFMDDDDKQSHSALNLSVTGSTRCQHCRHRCKSSADLLAHMKHCPEAGRFGNESYDSMSGESSAGRGAGDHNADIAHPMENRVFVWNKPQSGAGGKDDTGNIKGAGGSSVGSSGSNAANEENSYYGVETAPGYGEVTKKMTPEEEAANSSLKKVYKCPHCSFWASTASRFHVHIVGHLNKKPFECSLCSYRSNWRWDITKHIRLKTIRDPSHKSARVLMNDETGRRNYTKYNKYITLMKVTEEDGDPKLMKSGEMTPNQVASLAFYNDSKNSGNTAGTSNSILSTQLNGIKEDITLEPIINVKSGETQLSEDIIRLPLLATMVNAAMAQQQHQQNDEGHATLITPSVTISAVKRTPSIMSKASDDLIIDVCQEGNEKKTFYNCRNCSFRHSNRDAALAHVKIHYQDSNFPVVTATPMPAPKSLSVQNKQHATPLQVAVNQSNIYMNKVLAAMGFQQPPNSTTAANNSQQHSLLAAGLLQQAIQGVAAAAASPNSPLSGLALALAGKSPTKLSTAASILEHGEQKANPNEASAQNLSPACKIGGVIGSKAQSPSSNSTSLQYLLSSPRATYNSTTATRTTTPINIKNENNTNFISLGVGNGNNNLVLGATNSSSSSSPTTTANVSSKTAAENNASLAIVTTLSSASFANSSLSSSNFIGGIGDCTDRTGGESIYVDGYGASSSFNSNLNDNKTLTRKFNNNLNSNLNSNQNQSQNQNQISLNLSSKILTNQSNEHFSTTATTTMATTTTKSLSSPSLSSSSSATATKFTTTSRNSSQSPASALNLSNLCNNPSKSNSNNNNNVLSLNSERRNPSVDPSPYRCGHCHQVSNWKHVIQRHCRLKHNADVRIETLDRAATNINDRDAPPVYRPLGNNINNNNNNSHINNINAHNTESNNASYANAMKNVQHQQQQQHQQQVNQQALNKISNNNINSNNINSVLMSATEKLLQSPLAASAAVVAAANAATTQQDLNAAAAAYLAAAYRAATSGVATEDLILQQHLQQNDQIEITRLPPPSQPVASATTSANGVVNHTTSNLAQLLEAANQQQAPSPTNQNAQNSKSKQQKCPLCPYISESKSQMNYHISLHKPTQYECQLCTFVCAKKQHLSSHMRTAHHQYNLGNTTNNAAVLSTNVANNNSTTGNNPNLDFCVALQLAAATQNQQEDTPTKRSPLSIDMSALKSPPPISSSQADIKQELPAEYQYKLISYCSKCPARFAQKHNDTHNAKGELIEHLQMHDINTNENDHFKCEFCDFRAQHETLLQAHRHVHTPNYQEKFNELYKNCKDDTEYPAPKLMQITLASIPKTVWIVDNELSNELLKDEQRENLPKTKYIGGSSLLKKQLEAGQASMNENSVSNLASPKLVSTQIHQTATDCDESSSTLPSTSASVATSDLAADDTRSNVTSPALLERCLHCPFETVNAILYKTHLGHHICISNKKEAYTCDHCDYTDVEKSSITEHTRVHFNALDKLKSVAFFTSYDNLELSVEQNEDETTTVEHEHQDDIEMPLIKQEQEQEHNNNNNEDDVVNENTLKAQKDQNPIKEHDEKEPSSNINENSLEPSAAKKPCNKIILYKNEGQLSIKKNVNSSIGESISERLRRRISRNANNQLNGYHHSQQQQRQDQQEQETSQKAILVNAKTGEILKKH